MSNAVGFVLSLLCLSQHNKLLPQQRLQYPSVEALTTKEFFTSDALPETEEDVLPQNPPKILEMRFDRKEVEGSQHL